MQHPVSKRIKFLIDHYNNGVVAQFSERLENINQQTVNRIFHADSRSGRFPTPSTELLIAICKEFPEVDANWLLMGTGEPFVNTGLASVAAEKRMVFYDKDWESMYFEIVAERDLLNRKYVALLEKVAKP